jgi:hypothetical protein
MKNFDLTKYLAEGKLHEELNGQEVKFLAQYIADAFTEEDAEGDRFSTYMTYTVGDIDGNSFELDTKATEKTPEDDAKYGTGRGWGGSFRIKPVEGGYEVRNSEKGGLVATISDQGELTMLDAEQSKAEMGGDTDYMERRRETDDYMEEGIDDITQTLDRKVIKAKGKEIKEEDEVEEIKSNKMTKSELKEMIKSAFLNEKETFDQAFDRIDKEEEVYPGSDKDEKVAEAKDEEEDIEVDVDAEDVAVDMEADADMDMESPSEPISSGDKDEIQDSLEKALEAAKALGDQKLVDQIGNSITFFTRQHVVGKEEAMEEVSMEEAELDEDTMTVNEIEFPMWTKIKTK